MIQAGKLPNTLLADLLASLSINDRSLIVPPGVGQDTAVVDLDRETYLVLKSDPITFASDRIGFYAVNVNANDIATAGATPRWFLATVLLPPGTAENQVRDICRDLNSACARLGVTLCGGHTEVTDAVNRPVISGSLIGIVDRKNLVLKENMREGDTLIMTKSAGFEGTSVIAREFAVKLLEGGMPRRKIDQGRAFLDRISVVCEAKMAMRTGHVTAMHDVTEGGVSTALLELSRAGGNKLAVHLDRIPIHQCTREICSICGLDPLGLIGSGSLLMTVAAAVDKEIIRQLTDSGVDGTIIGSVAGEGYGIKAFENNVAATLPEFEVDELTRLFT